MNKKIVKLSISSFTCDRKIFLVMFKETYSFGNQTSFTFQTSTNVGSNANNANAGSSVGVSVTSSAVVSNTTTAASVPASTTAATATTPSATPGALDPQSQSKYQQLLSVIEEMSEF